MFSRLTYIRPAKTAKEDSMTDQDLAAQIISLTATLYRVSCGLLHSEADREDAVQTAIEKAWRKAKSLRDESKLKPWLIRILINECYSIGRRRLREIPTETLPDAIAPEHGDDGLREALTALPQIVRLPIVLHYMEGFTIAQIASLLHCPKGTVLSRMDRGRKQLKDLLIRG
jgi:RNA polymerase sigma-70 factor (ECF subfamily)